jgi:hypothetical protein
MVPNSYLVKASEPNLSIARLYRTVVGKLLHISRNTRPDIAYAVHQVSRFNSAPGDEHWVAVKRILRYLKGSISTGIEFKSTNTILIGYSDADHAACPETRRSVTGYAFKLGCNLLSWSSKTQTSVALSSTVAEYYALCDTVKETIWLRGLLTDLGYPASSATLIHEDNQATIEFCKNNRLTSRTKHIGTRQAFVHEHIHKHGSILLQYCPSQDMTADCFTKALSTPLFRKHCIGLGLLIPHKTGRC